MTMLNDIATLLLRELEGFSRELALYPNDDSLWKPAPGVTNAGGNLALHVAGNIQYFIGNMLGGTGYVRNREDEFGRRSGTRQDVISEINKAAAVVREILPQISETTLHSNFEPIKGHVIPVNRFLLHLCAHAGYHLGQLGYVRRIVTGDSTSSGALPLRPLVV
jgi:hypothetical protein